MFIVYKQKNKFFKGAITSFFFFNYIWLALYGFYSLVQNLKINNDFISRDGLLSDFQDQ